MGCAGCEWITKPNHQENKLLHGDASHSTFLCMLCLGHHFTSLFNQLSDLVSKLLWKNIARGAKSKINGQFCFSSMHKHKRHLTSAHIDCCVDCQLNIWQFGKPSTIFLIQQECTQYLLDCSMLVFSLSITLWMVSSGMKCFCTQEFPKRFPELHHKMWVSVAYNCLGNSKYLTTCIKNNCTVSAAVSV